MGKSKLSNSNKSVQEFTNVLDIDKEFLYTKDNMIISFVRIMPISIGLLSKREVNTLIKQLTAELSDEKEPFHFLAISRPVDVLPLIEQNLELKRNSDNFIQKELLQREIETISEFSYGEQVVERHFYFYLINEDRYGAEIELKRRIEDFAEHFEAVGIKTEILKTNEIIRLCNLVNNPSVVMVEDEVYEPTIPILKEKDNGRKNAEKKTE